MKVANLKIPLFYSITLLLIIGLVVGYAVFTVFVGKPNIAILQITGSISSGDAEEIATLLRTAKDDTSIKGVVLQINSPGGEASASEEIYLSVLDLRKEKPVVASVNRLAASGAYYIAIGANTIYAKPTSDVGNVGAISVLPKPKPIEEDVLITGPLKKKGRAQRDYASQLQLVLEGFLEAVVFQRGDRLTLSKQELAKAKIYSGIEAVQNGLVDTIGSTTDAIEKAAELAGVANYGTVYLNPRRGIRLFISLSVNESVLQPTNTVPLHYYLYVQEAGT